MGPYLRLRRDSYEDACNRLLDFGLVRYARPGTVDGAEPPSSSGLNVALATVFLNAWTRGDRYEPDRYQVTDAGLTQDALEKCFKESVRPAPRPLRPGQVPPRNAGADPEPYAVDQLPPGPRRRPSELLTVRQQRFQHIARPSDLHVPPTKITSRSRSTSDTHPRPRSWAPVKQRNLHLQPPDPSHTPTPRTTGFTPHSRSGVTRGVPP
jgi:hypothetical protein